MDDDWHTVHTRTKDKKQRQKEKQDEPASKAASTAADPFAEFDRAFAEKAAQKEQQQRNAFAELGVHEAPAAAPAEQGGTEEEWGSSADEAVQPSSAAPARAAKKQKPKPVRKPKLTVAQVAAGGARGCHAAHQEAGHARDLTASSRPCCSHTAVGMHCSIMFVPACNGHARPVLL